MINQSNYSQNKSQSRSAYSPSFDFPSIQQPLHLYYEDKAELFLQDGKAHSFAKKFVRIPSHQLRKILNQTKLSMLELEKNEENYKKAANQLFVILPLAAYNAGRDSSLKILYSFLNVHINRKTITCKEDIEVFDQLFTSIIAYHKYEEGNKHAKSNL